MKKKYNDLIESEIDLFEVSKKLVKEKSLILSTSILCALLAFFLTLYLPAEVRTEITIKKPPHNLFDNYNKFFLKINNKNHNNIISDDSLHEIFNLQFSQNIISPDNLVDFVEKNKISENLKAYLKKENISTTQYFRGKKFGKLIDSKDKNDKYLDKYFLIFPQEVLDADIFLNEYIVFTRNKTIFEFKKILKNAISNSINEHEQALDIAKKINLENPILKSMGQNSVVYEPDTLFYKGIKVLGETIFYYKKIYMAVDSFQFDYNPILDKASKPEYNIFKSVYLYILLGFIFGVIISLIIIFFRSK